MQTKPAWNKPEVPVAEIPGFENYCASQDGRIWTSLRGGKWLKPGRRSGGTYYVCPRRDGGVYQCRVGDLILETFVGPRPPGMKARPKNGIKADTRLENLQWGPRPKKPKKECVKKPHHNMKVTDAQAEQIIRDHRAGLLTQTELARQYGVCLATVHCIVRGKRRRNLGGSMALPENPPDAKPIPGFPGYRITEDGRVWSETRKDRRGYIKRGKWMTSPRDEHNRGTIILHPNGEHYSRSIARLILETYVGPCPSGMRPHYINGNQSAYRLENLRWGLLPVRESRPEPKPRPKAQPKPGPKLHYRPRVKARLSDTLIPRHISDCLDEPRKCKFCGHAFQLTELDQICCGKDCDAAYYGNIAL